MLPKFKKKLEREAQPEGLNPCARVVHIRSNQQTTAQFVQSVGEQNLFILNLVGIFKFSKTQKNTFFYILSKN